MPESPSEKELRELREFEAKNIAHYSVLLQAWIDTRMERDRTIVTLSAAGIGLLVTILTAVGVQHSWELVIYGGAVAAFLAAIAISLRIYERNSAHVEGAIHGSSKKDPVLERYDQRQIAAFIGGAILSAVVGVVSAVNHLRGESLMNDRKSQNPQPQSIPFGDSMNGIGNLAPREPLGKSLSGIGSLRPQAAQPAPVPSAPSAPANQPGSGQPDSGSTQKSTNDR